MKTMFAFIVVVLALGASAQAAYMYVGEGDKSANVLIEFHDGAVYAFNVKFEDPNTTGLGLFDIIEDNSDLWTKRKTFSWGTYIRGILYDGHSTVEASVWDPEHPEDYWHYYNRSGSASAWGYAPVGSADRIVTDGSSDGYVFGQDRDPRLPGDCNNDLKVDIGDLTVMGTHWNATSGGGWADGDFNGDGSVDIGDLTIMGDNWGFGAVINPAPIPEPATLAMLAAGAAMFFARRRRA